MPALGARFEIAGITFQLERQLERDERSASWRATNLTTNNPLFVKFAPSDDKRGCDILHNEARVLSSLKDQRFPSLVGFEIQRDHAILATEWMEGDAVSDQRLPLDQLEALGRALWATLISLHDFGIVHGDLKPQHILIQDDRAQLCDFGFALHGGQTTQLGTTVDYASPEQLGLVRRPISTASDLYSAGVILLQALNGHYPWPERSNLSLRLNLPTIVDRPHAPRSLALLLARLLCPDSRARYATARAVADDWDRVWAAPKAITPLGATDQRKFLTAPTPVGRQDEIRQIEAYITSPQTRPFWVAARSGRGKTHLLEMLEKPIEAQQRTVLWGRGSPLRNASFGLWNQLAGQLVEQFAPEILEAEQHDAFQAKASLLAQAFPVFGLQRHSKTVQVGAEALADALRGLIQEIPHRLVFLLDDVQWADPLVLVFLARELPENLKIVAAYRNDEFTPESSQDPKLELAPLDSGTARQLLLSMAGPLPEEAMTSILALAQGEPFLLSALLLGAQERGALRENSGGWNWTSAVGGVQTGQRAGVVLSERLARCTESELALLRTGAVLGREFAATEAVAIANLDPALGTEAVAQAVERHLLWRLDSERVAFSHDKVREALLDGLDSTARQSSHRLAAEWMESAGRDDPEQLSYHWVQSQDLERAFPHAFRAGDRAFARLDYASAIHHYRLARDSWPKDLESSGKLRILDRLAQALDYSTLYEEAIASYHQALEHADHPEKRVLILGRVCFAYTRAMRVSGAAPLVEEGLRLLGDPMPSSGLGKALQSILSLCRVVWRLHKGNIPEPGEPDPSFQARIRFRLTVMESSSYSGHTSTLFWSLLRGCDELCRSSAPVDGAILWANAGNLATMLNLDKFAKRLFDRAFVAAGDNARYLGQVTGQSGFLPLMEGDVLEALVLFGRGADMSASQDRWTWGVASSYVALLEHNRGNFRDSARIARDVWQHQSLPETVFFSSLLILAKCGQAAEFESVITSHLNDIPYVMRLDFLKHFALGLIHLQKGDVGTAIDHLDYATSMNSPELFIWGASCAAWLATAWRNMAEALPLEADALRWRLLRKAESAAFLATKHTRQWLVNQPHALREAALAAAHRGRFHLARSRFEQSFALSEKLGLAFESAWTLYERGRFAAVADWTDWAHDQVAGLSQIRRLEGWIPGLDLSEPKPEQDLAKLDRFDKVLESGRHLVALEAKDDVMQTLQVQAKALLRCERVLFVGTSDQRPEGWSANLHQRCLSEARAVTATELEESSRSLLLHEARATLMAPLKVEGELVGVLMAWQKSIGGFFGEEETRLADYLCTLAGAGLENARILAQRDQTFSALRTSEQRFRGFFEYAGVGTALLDEHGRSAEENPYLEQLLGRSTKGEAPWESCHMDDRDSLEHGFTRLSTDEIPRYDAEVRLRRAGGEVAWAQMCLVKLPFQDGDQTRYLLTVADTTHRRVTEMMTFLENERRSLAAEVRDELGQNVSTLRQMLSQTKGDQPQLQQARELAQQLTDDTSTLIASLRNPLAEGVDLSSALKSLIARFSADTGVDVAVNWPISDPHTEDLKAMVLYRVVQEGLANIRKHAKASQVSFSIRQTHDHLELTLSDNGKGLDVQRWLTRKGVDRHFGLIAMRERVEMVGGSFCLTSEGAGGATLSVSLPTDG